MQDFFMKQAILQANIAKSKGEIPVGAVIVLNNEIISVGHNNREHKNMATSHAEIEAINLACQKLNSWRLCQCDMYVTLEPCPMCAGAIINARIKNLYFGAYDEKFGATGSRINLFDCGFNHRPYLHSKILEDECKCLMVDFFKDIRAK